MIKRIIHFSVNNKLIIAFGLIVLIAGGISALKGIPLDAVPDITNNQVQVVSVSPTLAPQEVEQLITYPLESAMTNIPDVIEVRSISRYGLSVITIVFEDKVPTMTARQYVQEQLNIAKTEIPAGLAEPELMPITTGLGEIYQYVLTVDPAYAHEYDNTRLRTIQDWIVKRQLNGTPGIIEVSSFGGFLKQYEIAVDPDLMRSYNLSILDVIEALESNNENSGGSYIERGPYSLYIRTEGRAETIQDLESIPIGEENGVPLRIIDIAEVRIGAAKRYGAMTMDGRGEVVGGITLMLKGANSSEALVNVKRRIKDIESSLPEGVNIYPYLDRSRLIGKTTRTVWTNLLEGGAIVILVLLLLLGNFRAGLIVASVIPLSMLFAFIMMRLFGISANLMSLGAIDFGIVVDGAVIIVESLLHVLALGYIGKKLTQSEMDQVVIDSTDRIYRSAAFGVMIILVVFIPILTLKGIEGKTFRPMAQTVGFAILGSLILSLTYVPAVAALVLKKKQIAVNTLSDRLMRLLRSAYLPSLHIALRYAIWTLILPIALFAGSIYIFNTMGAEFVPTLEEGDLAMQQTIKPGSSLEESIRTTSRAESILLANFPEVEHVVSKIGTAEVPTDPMAIEDADIMIILKDKEEWTSAEDRESLIELMKAALSPITWASYEFTQPIQLRFNELMTGAKTDIAVKLFGENVDTLKSIADRAAAIIRDVPGAADVKVDQTDGLQQLHIRFNRQKMMQFGVDIKDVNTVIRAAYAGESAGQLFEEERKFDIAVRLSPKHIGEVSLDRLFVPGSGGEIYPISAIASVHEIEGPSLISREQARRFINIGVNVRQRDIQTLVRQIETSLESNLDLPAGYAFQYGGQFENLQAAKARLIIAVPVALLLILILLYMAFSSLADALIIFVAVPLSAIGGILALYFRDMPFSISSGIGFIALFGVAVLNGIVLVSAIKQSNMREFESFKDLLTAACLSRLRPVLMTALVAALGFLPMALSTSNGAEVQRPLATVVIGGLISSTFLTLIVLPALYYLFRRKQWQKTIMPVLFILASVSNIEAQITASFDSLYTYALEKSPSMQNLKLNTEMATRELDAIGQWAPLEINYQGGNMNTGAYDNWFEANQQFGHLLNNKVRRTNAEAQIDLVMANNEIARDEFKYKLYRAYIEAQYSAAKAAVWTNIHNSYKQLLPIIQAQHNAGEVDAVALSLARSEILAISHQERINLQEQTAYLNLLKSISFLPDSVTLNIDPIRPLSVDSVAINTSRGHITDAFYNQQEAISAEAEMQKAIASNPGLNLGAFAQSLDKEYGFYGILAGISLPLDRRTSRSKLAQLKIEQEMIMNRTLEFKREYDTRQINLSNQIATISESLAQYDSDYFESSQEQIRVLDAQFREGVIDFIKYQQIRQSYLRVDLAYIDLIHEYNKTALELMFFNLKSRS